MQVTEGVFSYIKQARFPSKQAAKQMEIKIICISKIWRHKIDHYKISKGKI